VSESVQAFDTVARDYDATRGGEQRGGAYAAALFPLVPSGLTLEVGVGTGVVALGLERLGRDVIGVDVSLPMLAVARERTAGNLVAADGLQLPFVDESFDCAFAVWVLHAVVIRQPCSPRSSVCSDRTVTVSSARRITLRPTISSALNSIGCFSAWR
jgi:ubiquinone/menaquinone biosynthesis C-methylase UbiE